MLAGIGLRDQLFAHIDPELAGIYRVERMLCIDEDADAGILLRLCKHMQRQRRLVGGFRSVDLDYTSAQPTTQQPVGFMFVLNLCLHIL